MSASALFRLLGDDVRLRLLRLVTAERLNVSELTAVLGIAQSGVSRHLGLLREAGLVREDREGGFTYYQAAPDDATADDAQGVWPAVRQMLQATLPGNGRAVAARHVAGISAAVCRDDDARLREIIRQRREERETHGAVSGRQVVPGRSWAAWSRSLGMLLPAVSVCDLGCGDGHLTLEMAAWASHVVGVDRSRGVVRRARALARRRGVSNVTWKVGEIERVPLDDASVELAVLSQVLHHARDTARAIDEAARIVAPGGRVLVLDLVEHDQAWVRDRLGDRQQGFGQAALGALMGHAGLEEIDVRVVLDQRPFGVIAGVGTRRPRRRRRGVRRLPRVSPARARPRRIGAGGEADFGI